MILEDSAGEEFLFLFLELKKIICFQGVLSLYPFGVCFDAGEFGVSAELLRVRRGLPSEGGAHCRFELLAPWPARLAPLGTERRGPLSSPGALPPNSATFVNRFFLTFLPLFEMI